MSAPPLVKQQKVGAQDARLPCWESTLARSISIQGLGVHSGEKVVVALHPAPAGSGIQFCRVDLHNGERYIHAHCNFVQEAQLCTTIVNESGTQVRMIEHLMSALFMACLDNVVVEIDAAEVPILDGSAKEWLELIASAGLRRQDRARRYLSPVRPVEARQEDRFCRLVPHDDFCVDFAIDYPHPLLRAQSMQIQAQTQEEWQREIAPARTFAFAQDIEEMRERGLCSGGSFDNVVVLDETGILNPEGLRFQDECLRHKILDLCGDLYLAGAPLLAQIVAHKSGHRLNNRLLRQLFCSPSNWRWVSFVEEESLNSQLPPAQPLALG